MDALMPQQKRTAGEPTKSQRQRHLGMKQLSLWVPDPHHLEFATEAHRQGLLLRGRPEETEALDFIAAAIEWPAA